MRVGATKGPFGATTKGQAKTCLLCACETRSCAVKVPRENGRLRQWHKALQRRAQDAPTTTTTLLDATRRKEVGVEQGLQNN